jgi:MSHA biogenesis protein MshG
VATYTYKARNRNGALQTGKVQAASFDAAGAELLSRNLMPIDVAEVKAIEKSDVASLWQRWSQRTKIDSTDLIVFSRQMYSLSKAGMPLDRAFRGLEASISNLGMKAILRDISAQLEKGVDLTGAFSRHPTVFNTLYLSLVHVGENTGRLDMAFAQVGKYLELDRSTLKQIKSATRYPTFVLVAIAVALAIITYWVIPVFATTFKKLNAELPWQTVVLINISDFVVAYWYLLLGSIAGAYILFKRWLATDLGALAWDKYKLDFPLIGGIFTRIALARFSRTFAMMMKSNVPIVQSLGVIAQAVGNRYIGEHVAKMRDGISKGESLHQSAIKSGMFSPLVLQMIAVGEESGSVDTLLDEVADFYDEEVEYDLKKLSAAIEPILIVVIAGMVLILALGVFLPIWDLANAAR